MKYFCFFLFFTSSYFCYSQEKYKEVHINTTFKGNDAFESMASVMLEAVKVGKLPIYTPLNKKRTSFEVLLYQLRGWTSISLEPQEVMCHNKDIDEVSILFNRDYILYYDVSNVMNKMSREPVYVQFFIPESLGYHTLDVKGPVFHFKDIKEAKLKLKGADLYLHEMIQNYQFQAYEVTQEGKAIPFRFNEKIEH
ncbi:hypothetical protein [Flammeovirga aprica]|uniref:Uncharacterized protein n=1 Tax=Flammeovirga aprica JL-4 TaxID=694437 RepID=A0A7X9X9H1_9BACT|nr:hypothetical protein [Flammeovirga aprica]NME68816.1 hypothetical protein [Flammeovirga aprica JL-4]